MDTEKAFKSIQDNIRTERYDAVRPEIDTIVSACPGDIPTLLKCASLLKVVDDEEGCQSILDSVIASVGNDPDTMYDTGLAVRSLGRAEDAYELMIAKKNDPKKTSEIARTMMMVDESEEALVLMQKIDDPSLTDRLLLCDILCSLGEFNKALEEAQSIIDEEGASYVTLVNICTVMIKMGKNKEAVKLARSHLKEDKKSADSLALGAYVMWINGKIPAAANYANRALQVDYSHPGALEVMAMCLVEKGKYPQAKVLAGVINEKDPANPAVIRILDACRVASNA